MTLSDNLTVLFLVVGFFGIIFLCYCLYLGRSISLKEKSHSSPRPSSEPPPLPQRSKEDKENAKGKKDEAYLSREVLESSMFIFLGLLCLFLGGLHGLGIRSSSHLLIITGIFAFFLLAFGQDCLTYLRRYGSSKMMALIVAGAGIGLLWAILTFLTAIPNSDNYSYTHYHSSYRSRSSH
ncbi:hypothetical protein FAI40_05000 [Acetobacteraceae bacterium]|nr:hypothetical protein FAI40_05000 [Acetobacteraceae bacterium]